MKHFGRFAHLVAYLGLFAIVLSLYPNYPAAAQTAPGIPVKAAATTKTTAAAATDTISVPVKVVNTPLPVTGNVNASVNGTVNANITNASVPVNGTVNANITNTPSVNVSSLPAVQLAAGTTVGVTGGTFSLANTSATPIFTRDVNSPTNQPFAASLCIQNNGPGTSCPADTVDHFRVPATTGTNSAPVLEAVIEYYSTSCTGLTLPPNGQALDLPVFTNEYLHRYYIGLVPSAGSSYYSNQETRIYADTNSNVSLELQAEAGECIVTISGFLVTQ